VVESVSLGDDEAVRSGVARGSTRVRWLARFGSAALIFFLVKGLAWLTVPLLVYWFNSTP
jgi:hypothetical protein